MLGLPAWARSTVGPFCLAGCVYLLARALVIGSPLGRLALSYLVLAIPFFTWYPEKFDYHLLPAAVLLLLVSICELSRLLQRAREDSRHPQPRRYLTLHSLLAGGAAAAFAGLLIANVVKDRELFVGRGEYDYLRQFIQACIPRERIAAFPNLYLGWLSEKDGRDVAVLPLFKDTRYTMNWPAVDDPETDAVVLPDLYFERLSQRFPEVWKAVANRFPRYETFGPLVVLRR